MDAENARSDHRRTVHHGMTPDGERLASNAERADPMLWVWTLAGCLALGALRWIWQHAQ
ncbi:hypothetical protein [Kitasatospora sp. MAA4]|uniref:hypothetical protein n=1 Tax=Kitasatospora sp. MAA4 TaxID=3035093 RepID=UPI002472FC08|nr:hypothetical protein [Kitasatospora sp. MAA4]